MVQYTTPAPTATPKPRTPAPAPTTFCKQTNYSGSCDLPTTAEKCIEVLKIRYYGHSGYEVNGCCDVYDKAQNCYIEQFEFPKIMSGNCAEKCISLSSKCTNVGTNDSGNNGKIMTWTKWSSCYTRAGNCNSAVKNLTEATVSCSGTKPEWTICRCKVNPYVSW